MVVLDALVIDANPSDVRPVVAGTFVISSPYEIVRDVINLALG
jgi:hypothetical protein